MQCRAVRHPELPDPRHGQDGRAFIEHYLLDEGPCCPSSCAPLSTFTELASAVNTTDHRRALGTAVGRSASRLI
jgi:hypothetical protein